TRCAPRPCWPWRRHWRASPRRRPQAATRDVQGRRPRAPRGTRQSCKGQDSMSDFPTPQATRIAVVGLGYVGLPLAVEFGKQYDTVGFDINAARVEELRTGRDATREVEPELLAEATRPTFTSEADGIAGCNVHMVTVSKPRDSARRPARPPRPTATQA